MMTENSALFRLALVFDVRYFCLSTVVMYNMLLSSSDKQYEAEGVNAVEIVTKEPFITDEP